MKRKFILTVFILCIIIGLSSMGFAKSENNKNNSANLNSSLNVFKVKGIKSGLIKVNKNTLCKGDSLIIDVVLPHSLKSFWDGSADAYIVIRMPKGELLEPILISDHEIPDELKNLFNVDLSKTPIAEGDYQIAIILVTRGSLASDALDLHAWHNGFAGLVSATTFRYNQECDPEDNDLDKKFDEDFDVDEDFDEETELTVTPLNITLLSEGTKDIKITGGSKPISITSDNEDVATVSPTEPLVSNGTVTVTGEGIANDTTFIKVKDALGDIVEVVVTIIETEEDS